jgi:3-isopropylmalate/(R)-2-methylmalate dehydratase small subunit
MNNSLMLVVLNKVDTEAMLADVSNPETSQVVIDVESMTVRSKSVNASFSLSDRHRKMFLQGLDMVGATLTLQDAINAFSENHWQKRPWLKDIAQKVRTRLA